MTAAPRQIWTGDTVGHYSRTRQREVVEDTLRLLAHPCETPRSDTRDLVDCIEQLLRDEPAIEVERHASAPHIHNLVARIRGGSPGRRLILNGHLDTFPLGDAAAWSVNPKGEERDGRIYGLGVSDMKGGLAASLFAMRILAATRGSWKGEAVITFGGDEETMGELGTQYLLDNVPHARGDAVLCADVGSPSIIRVGEKGLLWLKFRARGQSAHAAHVHRGRSAIDSLIEAIRRVSALRELAVTPPPELAAVVASASEASERVSGKGETDVLLGLTITFGTISGGRLPNLISDHAEATADIRLPLGITTDEVKTEIARRLSDLPDVEVEFTRAYEATWTAPDHLLAQAVMAASKQVFRSEPVVNMRVGASDARLYRRAGMPTIVCGLTPNNMGAADEFVTVEELMGLGRVMAIASFDYLSA